MKDKVIREILQRMEVKLSVEQMQSLETALVVTLYQYRMTEETYEVALSEAGWEKILRTFLATKRLENCAEGTLEQYNRAIRIMLGSMGKELKDVTTNDIRFYMASYQEQQIGRAHV